MKDLQDRTDRALRSALRAAERVDLAAGVDAGERAQRDPGRRLNCPTWCECEAGSGCDGLEGNGEIVDAVRDLQWARGRGPYVCQALRRLVDVIEVRAAATCD